MLRHYLIIYYYVQKTQAEGGDTDVVVVVVYKSVMCSVRGEILFSMHLLKKNQVINIQQN